MKKNPPMMKMDEKPGSRWLEAPVLLLGCGNVLFGDDGFGPAVIEHLQSRGLLPEWVRAEDVGTGVRDLLFDLVLSSERPRKILIVDAAQATGRAPGELCELPVGDIAPEKTNDFSVHHFPSLNLLKELDCLEGVEVRVLVAQVEDIPEEVRPGLSPAVAAAVPRAGEWVLAAVGREP